MSDLACSCGLDSAWDYGCAYGGHDRGGTRSGIASVDCRWTVLTSEPLCLCRSQDTVDPESGSENEGDHDVHGYGSLPSLAEHKMNPLYALEISKSDGAVKPVQDPPLPAYVVSMPPLRNLFWPGLLIGVVGYVGDELA